MVATTYKTLYLVRHAQSEQNVAQARCAAGDLSALGRIALLGYDAPLSSAGLSQLSLARESLRDFVASRRVELVAHSHYQRAVATARELFGGRIASPLLTLPFLHERTIAEWLVPPLMDGRIEELKAWLDRREEGVVVLVGHGQFFKRALKLPDTQPNVSIMTCTYTPGEGFGAATLCEGTGFPSPVSGGAGMPPAAQRAKQKK